MQPFTIRLLGQVDYTESWQQMQDFTNGRTPDTPDEFWLLEHPPIYTLGLAGREEHFLQNVSNIPIVRTDRGGQVTYHGPGQLIIYILVDLKRASLSIRSLVERLESGIINYLADIGIVAHGDCARPGVYIANKKIASLGLKVRKGSTYHGISFNYNMDLTPFKAINVCGYKDLEVVQLSDLIDISTISDTSSLLIQNIIDAIYKVKKVL